MGANQQVSGQAALSFFALYYAHRPKNDRLRDGLSLDGWPGGLLARGRFSTGQKYLCADFPPRSLVTAE